MQANANAWMCEAKQLLETAYTKDLLYTPTLGQFIANCPATVPDVDTSETNAMPARDLYVLGANTVYPIGDYSKLL